MSSKLTNKLKKNEVISCIVQILVKKIGLTSYKNDSIIPYCEGHKIDIDLGCFVSRQIALLDLDTFEPIYFRLEEGYHATS